MPNDDFVDVCLREFFRLYFVFLRSAEQIVQEGDIEFENLDEFDDSSIGNVEFTIEVESAGIAVRAIFRDLSVVDVARQFGGVLVFFVFGLEGPDADAILFAHDQTVDSHVFADHFRPVALVGLQQMAVYEAASGIEIALNTNPKPIVG